jgi:hypothetical protein
MIDDITIVFGFFAAFSDSMVNFILPGLFYLQSCKIIGKRPDTTLRILSYIYIMIGTALFFIANYNTILKMK